MLGQWRKTENKHVILIGAFCVILYEENWTVGANSGRYIARCTDITPDPFRILERDLDNAKASALRQVKHLVNTQLFNIQAFHDNLSKLLS